MKKPVSKQFGFSLIELSLTLIVIGSLALVAMTKIVQQKNIDRKKIVTEDLVRIKEAIQDFASKNGYYPCPARPGYDASDYQFATSASVSANGYLDFEQILHPGCGKNFATTMVSSDEVHGADAGLLRDDKYFDDILLYRNNTPYTSWYLFRGWSYQSNDLSGQVPVITQSKYQDLYGDIVKGDVPCKEIGLEQDCGISPDGNKYSYIVSMALTMPKNNPLNVAPNIAFYGGCASFCRVSDQPTLENPDINPSKALKVKPIKSWNGEDALDSSYAASGHDEVDFALIDYGENGLGAYNSSGGRNNFVGATSFELLNIKPSDVQAYGPNADTGGWVNEYIYAPIQPNDIRTNADKNYFDDIVVLGGSNSKINGRICVHCSGYTNKGLILENITDCAASLTAIQAACQN